MWQVHRSGTGGTIAPRGCTVSRRRGVTSDMTDARQVLKDAAQDVSAELADAAHDVKAEKVIHAVKSDVVQPDSPNVAERTGTE